MKYLLIFFIFLAFTSSAILPHDGPLISEQAPIVHLDLNVEPYHRWDHIIPQFKDQILNFIELVFERVQIPDKIYDKIGNFMNRYYKYKSYLNEMKGIADNLGIRWEKVLLGNFFYESSTLPLCSSILIKDIHGNVIHARNLDFPFWNYLSKMTAKVRVYKGDHFVGTWDQIIGSVIVLSGQNFGSFSVTLNTRFTLEIEDIIKNIFIKQYLPSAFLTRQVLEQELDYEQATYQLLNTNVTAPIYYIIGGNQDGMVIEKQSIGYKTFHDFKNSDDWVLVQTNYDWDTTKDDVRRNAAYQRIKELGQSNINRETLMNDVLILYPTLNIETIYSLIFSSEYVYDDLNLWYGNVDSKLSQDYDSYQEMINTYGETLFQQEQRITKFIDLISEPTFFDKLEIQLQQHQIQEQIE